jgi:uncharacterized protein YdeI (YjbR/CyaY-like superfamily)
MRMRPDSSRFALFIASPNGVTRGEIGRIRQMDVRAFQTPAQWRAWLEREHARAEGLMVRFYKKGTGIASLTYDEALDQALCFGWIDGVRLPLDAKSFLVRFTRRRARSKWSKRNTEHVARLIASGEMTPAGLREVEAAKADGRWDAAYDSPANMQVPADFVAAVSKVPKAKAVFATLTRANQFSIAYRLYDAKRPETRARRMEQIIAMLARGETFHPQKAKAKGKAKPEPKTKPAPKKQRAAK